MESGEDPNVAGEPGGASVWYSWTAVATDQVTIDTVGSSFDTLLGVYTGTAVNNLHEEASNNDADGVTSSVTFDVTSGTTYRIRVDGLDAATGTIKLRVAQPPPNDDFDHPFTLTGPSATRSDDTNIGATLEPGEDPNLAGGFGSASVWYSWTAPPESGVVTIDTATSDFDTLLGVYTGIAVDALTEVPDGSNDDVNPPDDKTSLVTFPVTPGTVYRIKVDGYDDAAGTINLHLAFATVPDAPTSVAAVAGAGQATVSWAATADGGSAITGYEVTRYIGGTAQGTTSVGAVTQAVVSGLTNGTAYTFKVAAKNVVGTGVQSAPSNAVTPRTVPDAPTGVTATAGAGQAMLNWTPPVVDGGSSISGYDVTSYVAGVAQGVTSVDVVTQATVTGLTNGTAYTFRVAAKNVAGSGAQSAESNVVTPVAPVPPAAPKFTLTVSKLGTGTGAVASSTGGISCGAVCSADLTAGTAVTLTATPDANSSFAGWSGSCTGAGQCTVTMDAAKAAIATFNQVQVVQKQVSCVVPNVKGKPLATAKRRLAAAHCSAGRVTKAKSKTVRKGNVISQRPKPGTKLASGAKVNLVVSRGRR